MGKKIGIMTGGGDCPGLNAAVRGFVLRGVDFGFNIIGFRGGWQGLIDNDFIKLGVEDVKEIIGKGGTILGTSRMNPLKKESDTESLRSNFHKLKLDCIVAIGGEETLVVANHLNKTGIPCVGIPKTMDNDLNCMDYTFGFDTSVTVAVDAAERLIDTGRSHNRIMILEVMGYHSGWVALFTGIASGADWILVPEEKADIEKMSLHLKSMYEKKKFAFIVISEGVELPDIQKVKEEVNAFGDNIHRKRDVGEALAELVRQKLGIETRVVAIGHIQRGGSPTLFDRILGTRVGVKAAELVNEKKYGMMAALIGNDIATLPLEKALGNPKLVDAKWLEFYKTFLK